MHSIMHAPQRSDAGSGGGAAWAGPYDGAVSRYEGSSAYGSHGPSVQGLQGSLYRSSGMVGRYEYLLTGEGYVQPPMSFAQPVSGLVKPTSRPVWKNPSKKNIEG